MYTNGSGILHTKLQTVVPHNWKRKMGMGERRKGNCHFFLTHIPLNHLNFFNINTNHVLLMQQLNNTKF